MISFYGLGVNELFSLTQIDYMVLNKSMIKLKAFERLEEIKVSSFSNLKEETRQKIIGQYEKLAGLKKKAVQVESFADLGKFL